MLSQVSDNGLGVKVVAGSVEAAAFGNIMMQAYGSGETNATSELSKIVKDTEQLVEFIPVDKQSWEEKYSTHKKGRKGGVYGYCWNQRQPNCRW